LLIRTYETATVGKCVLGEVSCNQARDYILVVGMHMMVLETPGVIFALASLDDLDGFSGAKVRKRCRGKRRKSQGATAVRVFNSFHM
jgi:hypothetical protein